MRRSIRAASLILGSVLAMPHLARGAVLAVGDRAPDFTLPNTEGKDVKLSDFQGKKNVVLAFYVLAFTGGWTRELKAYQADIAKFEATNTQVLGISVDSRFSNKEYGKQLGLTYPLLSDFQRKVSKEYGIFNEEHGFANRTTYVVDKQGIIRRIDKDADAIDPSGAHTMCSMLEKKK